MSNTTDNPLLGVWNLVRWEIAYGDDRPTTFPYGTDATGLIMYTHDGAMSACIARAGRKPLSSASVRSAPEAERLAAFDVMGSSASSVIDCEPEQNSIRQALNRLYDPAFRAIVDAQKATGKIAFPVASMAENFGMDDTPSATGEIFGVDADGKNIELLTGYRANRQDAWMSRKLPSKLANRLIDDFEKDGRTELLASFADIIPVTMIATTTTAVG